LTPPAVLDRGDQLLARSLLSCQDSVGIQSVTAAVEMRDAHPQELLQQWRHRALAHHGAEVRDHRAEVARPERDRPEHVRDVAALLQVRIEDRPHLRGRFVRREWPDPWIAHGASLRLLCLYASTPLCLYASVRLRLRASTPLCSYVSPSRPGAAPWRREARGSSGARSRPARSAARPCRSAT